MNPTQAIKFAKKRVHLDRFGRGQWTVSVYDSKHRAWWQGNPTQWDRAKEAYREDLIREALDALETEDAAYEANQLSEKSGRWDELVREFAAKMEG